MIQEEIQIPSSIIKQYQPYEIRNQIINRYVLQQREFILNQRYQPLEIIGDGAYGCVVRAEDKFNPKEGLIAIKKIERAFEHRLFAKRTLRELKILRLIKHENIVNLKTILLPPSRNDFRDVYMVTELMETDLAQVIKSDTILTDEHLQLFIYQVLRGLKYLHTSNILHRDLVVILQKILKKPRNLLLNKNCDVKICDFGLGRAMLDPEGKNNLNMMMTFYVETRWYRAPELLVSFKNYTPAVDIWSVGCIMAEMLLRRPFLRGDSSRQNFYQINKAKRQIKLIFELLGTPDESYVQQFPDPRVQHNLRTVILETGIKQPYPLEQIFSKNTSKEALDLLKKLLTFDYKKRITVNEALQHPFFSALHCPEDEPSGPAINLLEFEFEKYELTKEQIKDLLYEEILLYHFPDFRDQYTKKLTNGQSVINHIVNNQNSKIFDPRADDDLEHLD